MKKSLLYTLPIISLLTFSGSIQANSHKDHSKSEQQYMKKGCHSSEEIFSQMDTNKDGMISKEEFEANYQNMRSSKKKRNKKEKAY